MAGAELKADLWVNEVMSPWDIYSHGVTRVLAAKQTAYQDMMVVESGRLGKALVLDAKWQSCTGDEFMYHEPLVHPACLELASRGRPPKTVLVLGGGEGATVREALRWNSVERVTMVDIDGEVVDACKEHLPEMHQGAFDDPRTDLVIGDAKAYLDDPTVRPEGGWDVIISDLSDPIEDGPSFELFTREFYAKMKSVLADDGVLVIQSGSVEPYGTSLHPAVRTTVETVFDRARSMHSSVPGYANPWSYVLASDAPIVLPPDADAIDTLLTEHLGAEGKAALRCLDGEGLLAVAHTPKHLRDAIAAETKVFTLDAPPAFFGKGVASCA